MCFGALSLQSTPFARRETGYVPISTDLYYASIHSLRKKGDNFRRNPNPIINCFNPLPSQEGRQTSCNLYYREIMLQSTPFARRETAWPLRWMWRLLSFNPLPSQEGRRGALRPLNLTGGLQSTPFARRETNRKEYVSGLSGASIHSLRKKGDPVRSALWSPAICFNPLPSQEGRQAPGRAECKKGNASIHSLRKKGDKGSMEDLRTISCFNPLPSQEGRQLTLNPHTHNTQASIHSLRKKGDHLSPPFVIIRLASIHSLRKKGDWQWHHNLYHVGRFNPLPSQEGRP